MAKVRAKKKPVPQGRAPSVMVRIPVELVDQIDSVRDPLVPREPFIRSLIEQGLQQHTKPRRRK